MGRSQRTPRFHQGIAELEELSVLAKRYGLTMLDYTIEDDTIRMRTPDGGREFVIWGDTPETLRFFLEAYAYLLTKGVVLPDRITPSLDGSLSVTCNNREVFLSQRNRMATANLRNASHFRSVVRQVATIHHLGRDYFWPSNTANQPVVQTSAWTDLYTNAMDSLTQTESPYNKRWARIRSMAHGYRDILAQAVEASLAELADAAIPSAPVLTIPMTICLGAITTDDFLYSQERGPLLRLRPENVHYGIRIYDLANFLCHHVLDPEQTVFALDTYEHFAPLTFAEQDILPALIRFPQALLETIIAAYRGEDIRRDDIKRAFTNLQSQVSLADVVASKQRNVKPEPYLAHAIDTAYTETIWRTGNHSSNGHQTVPDTLPVQVSSNPVPSRASDSPDHSSVPEPSVVVSSDKLQKESTDWILLVYKGTA